MTIMNRRVTAIAKLVYGLIGLLSQNGSVNPEEASKLYAEYEQYANYENEISKFEGGVTNPITPDKARRRELSNKLDNNTITLDEAKKLKAILEEVAEAKSAGNLTAILAIIFLLILVVGVIAALSSR